MNLRENFNAILHYQNYDRLPVLHFGFGPQLLDRWQREGHITAEEHAGLYDGSEAESRVAARLGFDYNYFSMVWHRSGMSPLDPPFETKLVGTTPDGFQKIRNGNGVVELHRGTAGSIPAEVDYTLKDRASWEKEFLPRLQYRAERISDEYLEACRQRDPGLPFGIYCGSVFGDMRNFLGIENASYLYMDDEELYAEIIHTLAELWRRCLRRFLENGIRPDYGHYWEDICYKNGPLISPNVFERCCVPEYRATTELLLHYGIDIVSVDCDGSIESLVPLWLKGGVNTMFPIEVGTWGGSIAPLREKYGRSLRGVGGMCKFVLEQDRAAVDREIERLKPLIALGGYIPCPDHRLPENARWELVQYYCERMHELR